MTHVIYCYFSLSANVLYIGYFVNIYMGALGMLESSSDSLLHMMKELGIDNSTQKVIIKKIMNIAVRCTYYVFCRRNKAWTNPELLNF